MAAENAPCHVAVFARRHPSETGPAAATRSAYASLKRRWMEDQSGTFHCLFGTQARARPEKARAARAAVFSDVRLIPNIHSPSTVRCLGGGRSERNLLIALSCGAEQEAARTLGQLCCEQGAQIRRKMVCGQN